jgi:hypothetical protein
MTTAFIDFPAQQQAKQQIAENVVKWTQMLIEALKQNYVEYSIRGHQRSAIACGESVDYHQRCIDELKSGICPIDYQVETGKKYHKVIFVDGGGSRSVHCFIDKNTGEVYKSATWKSPAKGVRYDLRVIAERENILQNCDWAGGYLYAR